MKILKDKTELGILNGPVALTVGKFDCIHRGHDRILKKLSDKREKGFISLVFTFSKSPRLLLNAGREDDFHGRNLITNAERAELLAEKGIDILYERPFDEEFMHMPAEDFVRILSSDFHMKYICVTEDFHFGYGNAGDCSLLQKMAPELGFEVEVIPLLKDAVGTIISSSLIRSELKEGHIAAVNEMLGYEYFIHGKIVHGEGMGKRRLSYATINMLPPDAKLLPKIGVYVTRIQMNGREFFGMTDVGVKPTVELKERRLGVETHIFDFDGDVYYEEAKVSFLSFMRDEQKFKDLSSLQGQLDHDDAAARAFISSYKGPGA
ncbi:MAG: bifunctional riboflavin kinase/FAD synthetase [Lachnospiraceae bacterium]|nr:bifunctional riboflavin kinase/FAD synthetase [Lachnospiraceae bacterium]